MSLMNWAREMQDKYGALATEEPIVHSVLPLQVRNGAASPDEPVMGSMRYTGMGPDQRFQRGEPAGVVHENEMVLEAPLINDMGGPAQARSKIEMLRDMERRGAPGFAEGTGTQTAGDAAVDPNTPADPTPLTDRGAQVDYSSFTRQGLEGLSSMARGENPALENIAQKSRDQMASTHVARGQQLSQTLAQEGVEGGAARAAQAMERRQQGIEKSNLESNINIQKGQAMQDAQAALVDAGMRGEAMQEGQHQFDINQTRQSAIELFNAGDFEGAANLYKKIGVDADFSALQTKQTQDQYVSAMDGLMTGLAQGLPEDDPAIQNYLKTAWQLQNPGKDAPAFDSKEGQEWATNTVKALRLQNDPIYQAVSSLSDETISTLLAGTVGLDASGKPIEGWKVDDFTYANFTGKEAARAAISNLLITGGLVPSTDANGNTTLTPDLDNPAWDVFGFGNRTDPTKPPVVASGQTASVDDVLKILANGGTFSQEEMNKQKSLLAGLKTGRTITIANTGQKWEKQADGTLKNITPAVNPNFKFDPAIDDPFSVEAQDFLKGGDQSSATYRSVVKAAVDAIEAGDSTKLRNMDYESPIYKELVKRNKGSTLSNEVQENWRGSGRDTFYSFKDFKLSNGPSAVANAAKEKPMVVDGRLYYIVGGGVETQNRKWSTRDIKMQTLTLRDPVSGKIETAKATPNGVVFSGNLKNS